MRMDTSHHALDMNCAGIASTVTLDEQESATCSSINSALFKLRERSRRDRVPFPQSDSGVAIHFHIGTNDGSRPDSVIAQSRKRPIARRSSNAFFGRLGLPKRPDPHHRIEESAHRAVILREHRQHGHRCVSAVKLLELTTANRSALGDSE